MLPEACGLGQHFQDLGHSFSLYRKPANNIYKSQINNYLLVPRFTYFEAEDHKFYICLSRDIKFYPKPVYYKSNIICAIRYVMLTEVRITSMYM